ncbi:MAG: class I SAM-dependent methyltransferase [Bacillota bacterium]
MGCHGGFSLDEATRRSWYNPEGILQDLREGMIFVDIGCGDGFFSILASKKVGEKGKVLALDMDPAGIEKLKSKTRSEGLTNIITKVGKAEDTLFCNQCADLILYSMDLHDFSDPKKVLQNAKQMIKPTGYLIDLDWKKQEMPFGPPVAIRFSQEQASSLIRSSGFTIVNVQDAGPYHYILTSKP